MSGDPTRPPPATLPASVVVPLDSLATGPAQADPVAPAVGRSRRRRRIALAAGFITVAVAIAAVLIALALSQEQPRWWVVVDASDPRTISTAEAVENGITSALTQVRSATPASTPATPQQPQADQPWTVFITTDQANAWLNVRLKRWLADQAEQGATDFKWPPELGEVQVSFAPGLIHVGVRVMRPGVAGGAGAAPAPDDRPQTLAATLRPGFAQDGSLWLTAQQVQIGRLPLPASWVIGRAGAARGDAGDAAAEMASRPQTQRVLAAFKGERPVVSRPVIKLADGRRVRLLAIEPAEGKLLLTCITEQRERQPPR